MATINDRPDLLNQIKLYFDSRAYFRNTGIATYARAITSIPSETVHLKFETYERPPQDILQRWSVDPIVPDRKVSPNEVSYRNSMGWTVTPLTDDEDRQALLNQAEKAVNEAAKRVTSAIISMRFASPNKFMTSVVDTHLLVSTVDFCKSVIPSMNSDESTVIVHAGKESYHYDNLLEEDLGQIDLNVSYAPKYPNQNSQISALVRITTHEPPTEEKKE